MIIFYKGARGRGKTLSMVKDAFIFYLNNFRVVSNIKLEFGEYISNEDVLKLSRDSNLFDCVLVLDEVQLFFDSRNFSRESNKNFSNFLQQIRKRNVHVLCTTQYSNTVDLRLRQHIDILACPEFDENLNVCCVKYFDLTLLEDIEFVPSGAILNLDFRNPFYLVLMVIFFLVWCLCMYFGLYKVASLIELTFGFIFLFSGVLWILSMIVLIGGLAILFIPNSFSFRKK